MLSLGDVELARLFLRPTCMSAHHSSDADVQSHAEQPQKPPKQQQQSLQLSSAALAAGSVLGLGVAASLNVAAAARGLEQSGAATQAGAGRIRLAAAGMPLRQTDWYPMLSSKQCADELCIRLTLRMEKPHNLKHCGCASHSH